MEKIPTLFKRGDDHKVIDDWQEGCEWVLSAHGVATEKLDGMNVRLTVRNGTIVRLEKRRNPSKRQKHEGIATPWYVDMDEYGSEDKWLVIAAHNTKTEIWPDGEHPCEAVGPHIQGNSLALEEAVCVPFKLYPEWLLLTPPPPRSFEALKAYLMDFESQYSAGHQGEGIVWHHPDGRMAKIKRKDFA